MGKEKRLCFAGGGGNGASVFERDLWGFMEWEGVVSSLVGVVSFAIEKKYIPQHKIIANGALWTVDCAMSC